LSVTYKTALRLLQGGLEGLDGDAVMFMLRVYSKLVIKENIDRDERRRIRKKFKKRKKRWGYCKPASCVCCGEDASEVHHIIPISRGGTNDKNNLVRVCWDCHKEIHCEE
jgi:5-methylcytosine-specific restriction protein A